MSTINYGDITYDELGRIYNVGFYYDSVRVDSTGYLIYKGQSTTSNTLVGFVTCHDSSGQFLWWKSFHGSTDTRITNVITDNFGNVYIGGVAQGSVDLNPGTGSSIIQSNPWYNWTSFIVKLNPSGYYQWSKQLGNGNINSVSDLAIDKDNNLIVVGTFKDTVYLNPGNPNPNPLYSANESSFIFQFDGGGTQLFSHAESLTSGSFKTISIANDSVYFYIGGVYQGQIDFAPDTSHAYHTSTNSSFDGFLIKLDKKFNYQWGRTINGNYNLPLLKIATDGHGNIFTGGYFKGNTNFNGGGITPVNYNSTGSFTDIFYQRFAENGDHLWTKTLGNTNVESLQNICVDRIGNLYATGWFKGTVDFDPSVAVDNETNPSSNYHTFIHKMNFDGTHSDVWQLGNSELMGYVHPFVDKDFNLYLGGEFTATIDLDFTNGVDIRSSLLNHWDNTPSSDVFISRFTQDKPILNETTVVVCDSALVQGTTYHSDIYNQMRYSNGSKDSIVIIDINILSSDLMFHQVVGCDSVDYNNAIYTNDTTIIQYFTNQFGCDSTIHTQILIGHPSIDTLYITGCDSLEFNQQWYKSNSVVLNNFSSKFGCDSIIFSILTIHQSKDSAISLIACDSIVQDGIVYYSDFILSSLHQSQNGCDSSFSVFGYILPSFDTTINQASCSPIQFGGLTYTSSGIYHLQYSSIQGCDSNITLDLTVSTINSQLLTGYDNNDFYIEAPEPNLTYQWFACLPDGNIEILQGITGQRYSGSDTIPNVGVIIYKNGCIDTSNCYYNESINLDEKINLEAQIYPNPNNGTFKISVEDRNENYTIRIVNAEGKEFYNIQMSDDITDLEVNLKQGVYFVLISGQKKSTTLPLTIL